MFTKKIRREMPFELLRVVYEMYLEEHGHGIRNINDFHVLITAHELFSLYIPDLMEVSGDASRPLLLDNLKELESRGFMRCEGGLKYFLTVQGYDYAARNWWGRFVEYWNSNPGLNTLVAILSAGIASISLVVAIVAVIKSSASGATPDQSQTVQRLIEGKVPESPLLFRLGHSCTNSYGQPAVNFDQNKTGSAGKFAAFPCPLG